MFNLFIQERKGDYNLDVNLDNRMDVSYLLALIHQGNGYWHDATFTKNRYGTSVTYFWNPDGTVFIPFHRIDRIEVREILEIQKA